MVEKPTTDAPAGTPHDPESQGKYDIFIDWAIQGSEALRDFVHLDEGMFVRVHALAAANVRAYWLYAALDECQKAGTHLLRLEELLSGDSIVPLGDRMSRLVVQAILEEERMRERRLVELLVTLVLFTTTNEEAYYRHLVMLEELEALLRANQDQEEFHGAPSRNIQDSIARQVRSLQSFQERIDFSRAWYLAPGTKPVPATPPGERQLLSRHVRFSNMRQRVQRAMLIMTPSEKLCTGISYAEAYGVSSDAIHFGFETQPYRLRPGQHGALATKIGLLLASALNRTHDLLGRPPCAMITKLSDALARSDRESGKTLVERLTNRGLEVGDFVLANGFLAEILELQESKYGSRSYKVLYLAERPLPQVPEDWLPARFIQTFYTRQRAAEEVASIWAKHGWPPDALSRIQADPAGWQDAMRGSILELWPLLRRAIRQPQDYGAAEEHDPEVRRDPT